MKTVTSMTDKELRTEMKRITDGVQDMINRNFTSASLMAEVKDTATRYHACEAELQRRETVPA